MGRIRDILIGEENRLLATVYRDILERLFEDKFGIPPTIFMGHSCDAVVEFLETQLPGVDLVLIDYALEISGDKRFLNGMDLAVFVRKFFPDCKIIFLFYKANVFLVKNLIQEVDPNGILEKKDMTPEILHDCINIILKGGMYYGEKIREKRILFLDSEYFLDEWDRRLLYELSLGANRTQLAAEFPFSISTIVRKKRRLKEYFGDGRMDDRELIEKAKEMGFL